MVDRVADLLAAGGSGVDVDVRGKVILQPQGKEFFTCRGKNFFTSCGKEFFT